MRVLWFSNTPAGSEDSTKTGGGWLYSLDKAIQDSVELHVAFYSHTRLDDYVVGKTTYHPIYRPKYNGLGKIHLLFPKVLDEQDLPVYLNIIKKVKPDVIHVHGTEMPFACVASKVNIPVVVSIQGNLTVYYYKYCSGIESKYMYAKSYGSSLTSFFKRAIFSYNNFKRMSKYEQRNLLDVKYVIGRTDWDRRIMSVMAPEAKYYHCDEVLRDVFYSAHWKNSYMGNDKIIIHTTTGDAFYKGFETICETLQLLLGLGLNVEWRIAGLSNQSLITSVVKKKLKDNYPAKGLVLLGSLNKNDLVGRMLEAHAYVSASHIENSPNNVCEAMLLGMPCVATLAGGTNSMLKDGETGVVVQEGDPWSMAGALLELLNDRDKAIAYGAAAREVAAMRHSSDKIKNDLLSIYDEVFNHR